LTNDARIKYTPVVSPDNRYIVYATSQGGGDLWRINIDGNNPTLLTGKPADEGNPDISPDGKWLVYSAWTLGKLALWRMPIEGGEAQQLTDFHSTEPQVSPDGRFIACFFTDEKNINHLGIVPFEGGAPIKMFDVPQTVDIDMSPKWEPDGRGITFVDGRGGVGNLWLQPIDKGAPKQLTNFKQNGIRRREWTRDGKQVAIVRGQLSSDAIMITGFR
jgi:TolB protein